MLFFFRGGGGCLLISLPVNVVHKKINSSYSSCVSSVHSSLKIQLPDKKTVFPKLCQIENYELFQSKKSFETENESDNFTKNTFLKNLEIRDIPVKKAPSPLFPDLGMKGGFLNKFTKNTPNPKFSHLRRILFITKFPKLSQHEDHYFNDSSGWFEVR